MLQRLVTQGAKYKVHTSRNRRRRPLEVFGVKEARSSDPSIKFTKKAAKPVNYTSRASTDVIGPKQNVRPRLFSSASINYNHIPIPDIIKPDIYHFRGVGVRPIGVLSYVGIYIVFEIRVSNSKPEMPDGTTAF